MTDTTSTSVSTGEIAADQLKNQELTKYLDEDISDLDNKTKINTLDSLELFYIQTLNSLDFSNSLNSRLKKQIRNLFHHIYSFYCFNTNLHLNLHPYHISKSQKIDLNGITKHFDIFKELSDKSKRFDLSIEQNYLFKQHRNVFGSTLMQLEKLIPQTSIYGTDVSKEYRHVIADTYMKNFEFLDNTLVKNTHSWLLNSLNGKLVFSNNYKKMVAAIKSAYKNSV